MVIGGLIVADPVVVTAECVVTNRSGRRACAHARPVVRMWTSTNRNRAIAHGVIAVEERIVIAGTIAVKVAVAVGIIGPTGVARADKKRSAVAVAETADTVTGRSGSVVEGVVIAGTQQGTRHCGADQKIFFHLIRGTLGVGFYSMRLEKFFQLRPCHASLTVP